MSISHQLRLETMEHSKFVLLGYPIPTKIRLEQRKTCLSCRWTDLHPWSFNLSGWLIRLHFACIILWLYIRCCRSRFACRALILARNQKCVRRLIHPCTKRKILYSHTIWVFIDSWMRKIFAKTVYQHKHVVGISKLNKEEDKIQNDFQTAVMTPFLSEHIV